MHRNLEERLLKSAEVVLAIAESRPQSGGLEADTEVSEAMGELKAAILEARAMEEPDRIRITSAMRAATTVSRLVSSRSDRVSQTRRAAA